MSPIFHRFIQEGADDMLFIVRFTEKPGSSAIRQQYLRDHIAWLEEHKNEILVPGSLRPEPDAPAVGACWIVDAPGKAAVEKLFLSDPFWINGLRASVEILFWSKAFPDRKTPV